jgi:nitroreductase
MEFIVVTEGKRRQELARATGVQAHVAKAPVVIAAVATMPEYVMGCGVPAYAVDLAIAVDHMTVAAVDEGLGTCWIGASSQEKARDILNVSENYRIVTLVTLGFPKQWGEDQQYENLLLRLCATRYSKSKPLDHQAAYLAVLFFPS